MTGGEKMLMVESVVDTNADASCVCCESGSDDEGDDEDGVGGVTVVVDD